MYEYKCSECEEVSEELRPCEQRDAPATCPTCSGPATRVGVYGTPPTVNIVDRKTLRIPGRAPVTKTRKRTLGTDLGRIEPVKLGNAIHDIEQRYARDIEKGEQAMLGKGKK